jgi:predicted Zn-dependent protease
VGQTVAQRVRRRGIRYQFHLVESPAINAFALPGGHIYVTSGLLGFVESEAELAAILGHEISHVDLRHCIERYQYEAKLNKAGMPEVGAMVEIAHSLATFPFAHDQESDADAQGVRLSIEAGYEPDAAPALFRRMAAKAGESTRPRATTPAGEVAQSADEALTAFFRSHPRSEDRARDLAALIAQQKSSMNGNSFYIGRQNLHDQVAMASHRYSGEEVTIR